jgi:myo-inositol 2-dehydrogenase/D-chiro-inositol 1-dehydrogenase
MTNVAIFGAGRIGKIHAKNLAMQPRVKLKYVSDINLQAAKALAAQYSGVKVATSIEEVLSDCSVEAVIIASSTDTHADLIIRSSKAEKAIFCEKPVDLTLERARECEESIKKAGIICMTGFQRRFDPTFNSLKSRLTAGEIGDPEMLIITSRDPGPPPISYIENSGGIFKDMLIHDFDVFRWVLNDEASTVFATGSCLSNPEIAKAGDIDCAVVTIRSCRGRLCQINTARRSVYGYDQRFEVLGSGGMLQSGNHRPTEVTISTSKSISSDRPENFFLERYSIAYAREIEHFFEAITNKAALKSTIGDGVKALELAEAATLSWRENRVVELLK